MKVNRVPIYFSLICSIMASSCLAQNKTVNKKSYIDVCCIQYMNDSDYLKFSILNFTDSTIRFSFDFIQKEKGLDIIKYYDLKKDTIVLNLYPPKEPYIIQNNSIKYTIDRAL